MQANSEVRPAQERTPHPAVIDFLIWQVSDGTIITIWLLTGLGLGCEIVWYSNIKIISALATFPPAFAKTYAFIGLFRTEMLSLLTPLQGLIDCPTASKSTPVT